ncbi:MAG TPA: hypothetical protein VGH10_07765 [Actinomycetota bacterium]
MRSKSVRAGGRPAGSSRGRVRWARWLVPAVIVAAGLTFVQCYKTQSPATGPVYVKNGSTVDPSTLPGMQTGAPPWGPGTQDLRQRLVAIGLPPTDGGAMHIHAHLDVFVEGRSVPVPAQIGIDPQAGFLAPLHTHDGSGIVHVESPVVRTYTLGEFFDVWGVRLTATCLGDECASGDRAVRVWVDGHPATGGDPRHLALFAHEEIVVTFGSPEQVPDPIPSSHGFPFGS